MGKCLKQTTLDKVKHLNGELISCSHTPQLINNCGAVVNVNHLYTKIKSLKLPNTRMVGITLEIGDNNCIYITKGDYPNQIFAEIEVNTPLVF